MLIDTHCHLQMMLNKKPNDLLSSSDYQNIAEIITTAKEKNVTKIINVGTSIAESKNSLFIAEHFDSVYATVGVHPCDLNQLTDTEGLKTMQQLNQWLEDKEQHKIIAIGETGLDFFHKPYNEDQQIKFFNLQIELALLHNLPLVLHVREAGEKLLRVVEPYIKDGMRGVVHCFSQDNDFAKTVLDWGFYCGIDAPIGYPKNETLRTVVNNIPLERLILETDAPFLPPQEYRGKKNSPIYLPLIAQILADVKKISYEDVEKTTTENACKLFNI